MPIPSEGSANDGSAKEWSPGLGRVGLWEQAPVSWGLENPDAVLDMRETLDVVERAVVALPENQRRVVLLRDVEDLAATDVCNILAITETNQRVLLHRGRARIRRALDQYMRGGADRQSRPGADAQPTPAARAAFSSVRTAPTGGRS